MALSKKNATGIAGGVFTAAVSTLLLALYASKVDTRDFASPMNGSRDVYFCSDAPVEALRSFKKKARPFWEAHGVRYGKIIEGDDCAQTCPWKDENGSIRNIVCHPDAITVTLMSAQDMNIGSGAPGDRGYYTKAPDFEEELGQIQWYTLTFPAELDPPTELDENGLSKPVDLPAGAYDMVIAHAFGHAEGIGHTYTKVFGSERIVAEKTGELMNSHIQNLGWGDKGLPKAK